MSLGVVIILPLFWEFRNKLGFALGTAKCYNPECAGESSSGRTADSGSVREGSNPSSPAIFDGSNKRRPYQRFLRVQIQWFCPLISSSEVLTV